MRSIPTDVIFPVAAGPVGRRVLLERLVDPSALVCPPPPAVNGPPNRAATESAESAARSTRRRSTTGRRDRGRLSIFQIADCRRVDAEVHDERRADDFDLRRARTRRRALEVFAAFEFRRARGGIASRTRSGTAELVPDEPDEFNTSPTVRLTVATVPAMGDVSVAPLRSSRRRHQACERSVATSAWSFVICADDCTGASRRRRVSPAKPTTSPSPDATSLNSAAEPTVAST